MNYDTFQDRLKHVMGGESNHSFAIKCKISEGSLRNYLKGGTSPDLKTLQVISEVSGYSLAWLASGEGEMKRGGVTYPPAEQLNQDPAGFIVAQGAAKPRVAGAKKDLAWFHDWIDEEISGKSLSDIMAMAVKIKAVLDEGGKG